MNKRIKKIPILNDCKKIVGNFKIENHQKSYAVKIEDL